MACEGFLGGLWLWLSRKLVGRPPAEAQLTPPRPSRRNAPPPTHPEGDDGIKHLFSRGAHFRFHYGPLLVMLGWYFLGAAFAAGSAISSGLFVPMIMMGAVVGRIVGLATTEIASKQIAGEQGVAVFGG
jgi:hypothetical protein